MPYTCSICLEEWKVNKPTLPTSADSDIISVSRESRVLALVLSCVLSWVRHESTVYSTGTLWGCLPFFCRGFFVSILLCSLDFRGFMSIYIYIHWEEVHQPVLATVRFDPWSLCVEVFLNSFQDRPWLYWWVSDHRKGSAVQHNIQKRRPWCSCYDRPKLWANSVSPV